MEATSGVGPLVGQPGREARSATALNARAAARHAADWPATSRVLPWALFGFVAMLWLIPFDSIKLPFGGPVDATLDRPLLIVLAGFWLLASDVNGVRGQTRMSSIHWAFAIFIAIAIFSVLAHAEALVRVEGLDLAIKQLALLISYGLFFALAASIVRASEVTRMVTAMLVLASFTALMVIVEYRLGINVFHDWIGPLFPGYVQPPDLGGIDSIGRKLMYGPAVQPLAVAVMLSMTLPFAVAWLLKAKERRERLLYAAMVLLLIGGAVATQKKTSMVGPLVAMLVLTCYRPRAMARLAPLAIVLVGVVHFVAPGALGAVVDQFAPSAVTQVDTTQDRVSDYEAVKPDLVASPVLGRGYGSYDQIKHRILDNQYLGIAIGVGLVGLVAYLAIFATSFLSAHRVARFGGPDRAPPALGAAAAIVVAVVAGALLDFLSFPQLPYLFCFIAAIAFVLGQEHLAERRRRVAAQPRTIDAGGTR
ncbi:MAG TPA: O-antigen ligase family protein [Solirubrobacterales bacterium]|nr:O-antigen ligase family protein [Solirubrobacterales bacterium]